MNFLEIEKVVGREILDSRGNPTVEAEVNFGRRNRGKRYMPQVVQSTGEIWRHWN